MGKPGNGRCRGAAERNYRRRLASVGFAGFVRSARVWSGEEASIDTRVRCVKGALCTFFDVDVDDDFPSLHTPTPTLCGCACVCVRRWLGGETGKSCTSPLPVPAPFQNIIKSHTNPK